eukprot:scaffold45177_cov16-Prasinocladus_malaysianus.AAC.2
MSQVADGRPRSRAPSLLGERRRRSPHWLNHGHVHRLNLSSLGHGHRLNLHWLKADWECSAVKATGAGMAGSS